MAGEPPVPPAAVPAEALRLGVPRTVAFDGIESEVAAAFERAAAALGRAGAKLVDLPLREFAEYAGINATGGFAAAEAYAWHAPLLARRGTDYDPRVRVRIERGGAMTAADYIALCRARAGFIARVASRTADIDALVMPTVPIVAPPAAAFARDEDYARLNALLLRNTSLVNFLDGCAVTLPVHTPGAAPVVLMLVGRGGEDRRLLAVALGIEATLAAARAG
jgi:aspartyl-tRNA(Asn)/glutamyl-tRNA(Gln) amidotransferase subunit A